MTNPQTHPLPGVSVAFSGFPLPLIKHLRHVLEAPSSSDAFACYCNLLEWLALYLDDLANSVYKARPAEEIDDKLEPSLREISPPVPFGHAVRGLRFFGASGVDFQTTIPELAEVLRGASLPIPCVRLVRAFALIHRAREQFDIPPARLDAYLVANLPGENTLGKAALSGFFDAIVPFRNKGIGHQADESWFPRDSVMYALVRSYLDPAVDALLTWSPLLELLSRYEVVDIASLDTWTVASTRVCSVIRPRSYGRHAPLGPSRMVLTAEFRLDAQTAVVARRGVEVDELIAVVRHFSFPSTLQSSDVLVRRYARQFLLAYLERGLITPTQREGDLLPFAHKLALSERDRKSTEDEIQAEINRYASEEPGRRADAMARLQALVGPAWAEMHERVLQLLDQLPARRKEYVFLQIDDNVMMSFEQLAKESELSEPDLDTVLAELEQEKRVRRVGIGDILERSRSHFKAQDPQKPMMLSAILLALRNSASRPKRGYPEEVWRLVGLCVSLLIDDGLVVDNEEVESYRAMFDAGDPSASGQSMAAEEGEAMLIKIGDDELRPTSVRHLLEETWGIVLKRGIDPNPVLPHLMGKSRYLVSRKPVHANGTSFAVPCKIGSVYFECNLTRAQAVAEVIRLLRLLGVVASSPDVEPPRDLEEVADAVELVPEDTDRSEISVTAVEGSALRVYGAAGERSVMITGPSVRRFFAALLDYLFELDAPLGDIVPVRVGRIRYLLSEEPYHANGRPFEAKVERGGYFMNTAFTYEQALVYGQMLCHRLGLGADVLGLAEDEEDEIPLRVAIGGEIIEEPAVPGFLVRAIECLYEQGLLKADDIPYKSGRVRYLISEVPTHDHGRAFIRPQEIHLGGKRYFVEANVSRRGARGLIERLIASSRWTALRSSRVEPAG